MYICYTTQRRCRCTYSVDTYSTCPLEELCRIPCASVQRKRGTLSAKNQNYAFFRVTYFLTWQFINNDYCNSSERRGALRGTTTFSKLGVQFLGLGYYTERNMDGIPSYMHCSVLRNGIITLFIKKVWVVHPNFGGPDPGPPSGCAFVYMCVIYSKIAYYVSFTTSSLVKCWHLYFVFRSREVLSSEQWPLQYRCNCQLQNLNFQGNSSQ